MPAPKKHKSAPGFTLVELLVVISIISVLSVIGIVSYRGLVSSAQDARRVADIDSIAKSYEIQKTSNYQPLPVSYPIPQDPDSSKGEYFRWLPEDGSGFKVCASLKNNPSSACNTPSENCYCKLSSQGTINPASSANTNPGGSAQQGIGLGGSSYSSCDTNGTLLSGLVGYWKMDEGSWSGAGSVIDSSGYNNHGTPQNNVNVATGNFGNAGDFDGTDDYVNAGNGASLNLAGKDITYSAWIKPTNFTTPPYPTMLDNGDYRFTLGFRNSATSTTTLESWINGTRYNSINTITSGAWTHIAVTLVNSTRQLRFYINGSEDTTQTISANPTGFGTQYLGSGYSSFSRGYRGLIDDARVYERVLSPAEIALLSSGCLD